ncbi:MAG: glycosyltransferase family A protein [Candidatus Moranbacteria bacterium]|nr:glycosyltransferase family A protein [Candidatus Moranbacteria bacterium]
MNNLLKKAKPRISVLTPTIRLKGLEIVRKSLEKQTFQDFEWLIGSSFDPKIKEAKWVKDNFKGGFWTFNRISSKMCKAAKGEVVVFWQDFIWGPRDALEKFYNNVKANDAAISGVGDQYCRLDDYGRPVGKIWDDPRKSSRCGILYECFPNDWEINFAAIKRIDLERAGWFVDEADFHGYGGDNVLLAKKLDEQGMRFFLDKTLESRTLRHGRERKDWDDNHLMHSRFWVDFLK